MTTNSRTSHRFAVGSLAATAVAVVVAASPAVAMSHPAYNAMCSFATASPPQTADAADGWYDQCRTQQHVATEADPPGLPDTDRGWFIQRKTGERFATDTGPPGSEATDASTPDPPADGRCVLDGVP
jgi:hypothetical protein